MNATLSGLLAEPLPWWFWGLAGAAGAWGVAEFSGAPKRRQEIATLAGLATGAIAGFLLQPSASGSERLITPKFGLGAMPGKFQRAIRPATGPRPNWPAQ